MKNELQYKLTNYEATPPEHIWAEIQAALTDQTAPHAALLYQFEQAPPAELWDKIENGLSSNDEKIIPISNRRIPFGKYAAAAAILVLIASAITFFITKEKGDAGIAKTPEQTELTNRYSDTPKHGVTNEKLENTTVATTKGDNSSNQKRKEKTLSGRYLTIADDEGKKIRLSKKVASVFNCADNIASVKGIRCKEDIESLQQKISASLVSPSGDFSGLIDMIKSLEENK